MQSPIDNTPAPREKMALLGVSALRDDELLAVLLRTGFNSVSALSLAGRLLSHFGGLRGLLLASPRDLLQHRGLGPVKSAQITAVLELSRRFLKQTLVRGAPLESPEATQEYLKSALRDLPHEVFACLFLDTRHRVIAFEELFHGTITGVRHAGAEVRNPLSHSIGVALCADRFEPIVAT